VPETQTKHTPGTLVAMGYHIYAKDTHGPDVHQQVVDRVDGRTDEEGIANAERLALAWNCHDPLVATIEDLCQAIDEHERRPDYFDGLRHAQAKAEAALALTRDH